MAVSKSLSAVFRNQCRLPVSPPKYSHHSCSGWLNPTGTAFEQGARAGLGSLGEQCHPARLSPGEPPARLQVTTSFALEKSADLQQVFKVFRGKIKYLNGTGK